MESDDDYANGESEPDFENEDWYKGDSDTDEDIPDVNLSPEALYQDVAKLPEKLDKKHFEEGIIYALTLHDLKSLTFLGMLIHVKKESFIFRIFTAKGSSRKTFHEGLIDKK